jgi:hypothetical protein
MRTKRRYVLSLQSAIRWSSFRGRQYSAATFSGGDEGYRPCPAAAIPLCSLASKPWKKGQSKIVSCDTTQQQERNKERKRGFRMGKFIAAQTSSSIKKPLQLFILNTVPSLFLYQASLLFYFYIRIVNLDHFVVDTAAVEEAASKDCAKNDYFILRTLRSPPYRSSAN